TSTFAYNGLGLPESESTALYDLDARTTTYTYDGSGNVLTRTHNGETVTYTHDGLGRIKTIDKGDDRIVNYHYIGSSTKIIGYPEADSQWEGYYDGLGRIDRCRSIGPDSETLLDLMYTYDENSNRDSVKYNHLAVPVWDIYTYDNLQRLIQADYGSATGLASLGDYTGDVRFAAGVASKWLASDEPFAELAQLQVRDVRQQQRLVHTAIIKAGLDTVVKEHNNGEMPVVTLVEFGEEEATGQSTYEMIRNDSGDLIGIVVTDFNGRITLFTLYPAVGGTLIINISYDVSGNELSKVFSSYDEDGSLVEQVDMLAYESRLAGTTTQTTSITSQPVSLQEDLLDDGGSMMMMSMPEGPQAATEGFAYDHLGNRYQVAAKDGFTYTYTHNLNNQYTHIHGEYVWGLTEDAYPEYDDNGNLQTDKWGRQYSYDYRNRLTEIDGAVQYGYDALGRRVSKYDGENNLTTYFYYDSFGRVIAEYEKPDGGDEAFARSFVYGNGIDEVLAMFLPEKSFDPNDVVELSAFCEDWLTSNATYDYDSSGVVDFNDFAVLADDSWSLPTAKETRFYYLKDALGSVVGIVGGRFQRVSDREFYLYDVYGTPSESSVPSAAGNPYLFAGYRYDPESGLYYIVNRTYDAETGRFLQTDPIGYADSMNLYEYVMSNPTNWVDPYGLKSLYKDQWSWWDRFRFENGMVGGWFGLSHEQTRRMDNYWLQYQRAQMLNQHPNEAKEYCKAAKSIASGCAKKAVMGYCEYIVFVDENGYGAVREKIIGYVAEPYTNRILMCYEYNGQDIDQAIADACNWQMVGADLVGLTDMSYGVDYLQGKESIDTTTGRTFRGQEQYVRGFQGTSQFCGTVAACAEGVMSCGTAVAGARAAPVETATGETYSVAYQTKLNPADFGGSRAVHFNRANASLDAALRSDPAFAAQMDQLIPGVGNSVSSVGGRATPSSWIWHHSTESGVMQLVPKVQHTPGSIFWDTMHPGGPGGYSIWAIPAGAPKN
ncbi:MAG TPA: RHS repeat-associated core domain-containing protein, partial [Anaerohalosphaeraceae bacterium]|nr:RHS repeat-associated core domain-containing protein [Anaerohalosphaeraceae bacterium]